MIMGLDMYLTGERHLLEPVGRGDLKGERYKLGYWRKHPDLHGYIVETFAYGLDDCREICLFPEDIDTSDPWQFRNVLVR